MVLVAAAPVVLVVPAVLVVTILTASVVVPVITAVVATIAGKLRDLHIPFYFLLEFPPLQEGLAGRQEAERRPIDTPTATEPPGRRIHSSHRSALVDMDGDVHARNKIEAFGILKRDLDRDDLGDLLEVA